MGIVVFNRYHGDFVVAFYPEEDGGPEAILEYLFPGVKVGYCYGALTVSLSSLAKNRSLTWLGRFLTLLWTIICQDFSRRAPRCVLFGVYFHLKDHPTTANAAKLLAAIP